MSSDQIQTELYKVRSRIGPLSGRYIKKAEDGLELTRMQNFLEGRADIFDVLESRQANRNLHAKKTITAQKTSEPSSDHGISALRQYLKDKLDKLIR